MKYLALLSIRFYQKYISPYKGFCCAHAFLYKGDSCSHAVKKLIEENGVCASYPLIKIRFSECKMAYKTLSNNKKHKRKKKDKKDDCCDPCSSCEVINCIPTKSDCSFDLPCDCTLL